VGRPLVCGFAAAGAAAFAAKTLLREPMSREAPALHDADNGQTAETTTSPDATPVELTVVMPCLNEAETLETCISKAAGAMREHGIHGEVLVADNGSSDGSVQIARRAGARVVEVPDKGYGNCLLGGIASARGKYVIMGDADDSYDFTQLQPFLDKLREGYDLVMGNRFRGGIRPGAMPALHRYLGNPALTGIGRLFFGKVSGDFHCGLRGFSRAAIDRMNLRTTGMEFASEMVVKAALQGMRIAEVATTLSPDGRSRPPHLKSWRDGWRHLRFLLVYSPRWLFLYPGAVLMLCGLLVGSCLVPGPRTFAGVTFDVHTLLYSAAAIILGFQAVTFAMFTNIFAITESLRPEDPQLNRLFPFINLEVGLIVGAVLTAAGFAGSAMAVSHWSAASFGQLQPGLVLRLVIPATTALLLGLQIIFASFFLSVLGLARR
jgi:glycosyltransferase involved in cell wall biosynthesis